MSLASDGPKLQRRTELALWPGQEGTTVTSVFCWPFTVLISTLPINRNSLSHSYSADKEMEAETARS